MNIKRVLIAGVGAGLVFYLLSLVVYGLLKFLPIVPVAVAIPPQGLIKGWPGLHLVVALFIGIMWAIGYSVYGKGKAGGWLYGAVIFLAGSFPAFVVQFIISAEVRTLVVYGAIVSLVGALLGGRAVSLLFKR